MHPHLQKLLDEQLRKAAQERRKLEALSQRTGRESMQRELSGIGPQEPPYVPLEDSEPAQNEASSPQDESGEVDTEEGGDAEN